MGGWWRERSTWQIRGFGGERWFAWVGGEAAGRILSIIYISLWFKRWEVGGERWNTSVLRWVERGCLGGCAERQLADVRLVERVEYKLRFDQVGGERGSWQMGDVHCLESKN